MPDRRSTKGPAEDRRLEEDRRREEDNRRRFERRRKPDRRLPIVDDSDVTFSQWAKYMALFVAEIRKRAKSLRR